MKKLATIVLALAIAISAAHAQVHIDKSRPFPKRGQIGIENAFGSIKIIGWDKEEVSITGVLAPGAKRLDLSNDKEQTWIDVETRNVDKTAEFDTRSDRDKADGVIGDVHIFLS